MLQASDLHVFCARFNPIRYETPDRIYREWAKHMLESGVSLTVIECQYGERPFNCEFPGVRHIGVRAQSPAWTKECLINIGIQRTPEAQYICWCDSDVFFEHPRWARETLEALQLYRWVQPWSQAIDRGPHGEILSVFRSFCHQYEQGAPLVPDRHGWRPYLGHYPHPGYCVPAGVECYGLGDLHGASVRRYDGDIHVIRTASGNELPVTPNHPILTDRGWVKAAHLRVGDNVFSARPGHRVTIEGDKQHVPTLIEEIARSFSETPGSRRTTLPTRPEHFHGDGEGSEVAIVWTDSLLRDVCETQLAEEGIEQQLRLTSVRAEQFLRQGPAALLLESLWPSTSAIDRISRLGDFPTSILGDFGKHPFTNGDSDLATLVRSRLSPSDALSFADSTDLIPALSNPSSDSLVRHADNLGNFVQALAHQIESDRVINLSVRHYSGHVYNLSTKRGAFIANNLVTHNCHASTRRVLEYAGGLFEIGGMGASDHAMCLALVGKAKSSVPVGLNDRYVEHLLRWQERIRYATHGRIGYANGVINHAFHGAKKGRQYLSRWEMFLRHGFDPDDDLMRNTYGVLEWSGTKPELVREWMLYLKARNEDCNATE